MLSVRIAVLLTIALLPLGLLAVLQTNRAVDAAQDAYRSSVLAQTSRASSNERQAVQRAFGVASALADAIAILSPDERRCRMLAERAAISNPDFLFVGSIVEGGISRCNNMQSEFDFSGDAASRERFANPRPAVTFNPAGGATGQAVVIVSQPIYDTDGMFQGFVSISFPSNLPTLPDSTIEDDPSFVLVTFNSNGELLNTNVPLEEAELRLPGDIGLRELVGTGERTFAGESRSGEAREFALIPIQRGLAYALGSWEPHYPWAGARGSLLSVTTLFFPLLMWLVSLAVAILALRRQVIKPIRILRMRMRNFADGRSVFRGNVVGDAPTELREIGGAFESMADQIVRDEAELENQVREREMLLREVHHRVKNNLQLMSSIINMQIRQSKGSEAERALESIQSRLASLAKFHQDLYETASISRLRVDELLDDLLRQMLAMGHDPTRSIKLDMDLAPVVLTPDQASPLAMFATEALTNALKYASADPGDPVVLKMALSTERIGLETMVRLEIENTVSSDFSGDVQARLGSRLIAAFGSQLDARITREHENGRYRISAVFARDAGDADD